MNFLKKSLHVQSSGLKEDLALLTLRGAAGGAMLFSHGLGKLMNFGERSAEFPDPLGVSPPVSMALTIFAEFVCAGLLAAGAFTRIAASILAFTMAVAFVVIHAADPFQKKELAFLYLATFIFILIRGPGKYSIDNSIQ